MTLQRKTPMKRGVIHRGRVTLSRKAFTRAMSKKTAEAAKDKPAIREAVFRRDGQCLLARVPETGPCYGQRFTPHHLLKANKGGAYTERNLVTLCSSHQTWVEDQPYQAWMLGLVIRHGETHDDAWAKMRAIGLVP